MAVLSGSDMTDGGRVRGEVWGKVGAEVEEDHCVLLLDLQFLMVLVKCHGPLHLFKLLCHVNYKNSSCATLFGNT